MNVQSIIGTKGPVVATITQTATLRNAVDLLTERRIGALVVSGDGKAIEGIISERDIVRGLDEHGAGLLTEPVSSVMTAEVRTCTLDVSVHDLAQLMTDHRIRHVPVVEDGKLIGIVSIGDVVKSRLTELEQENRALSQYISGT